MQIVHAIPGPRGGQWPLWNSRHFVDIGRQLTYIISNWLYKSRKDAANAACRAVLAMADQRSLSLGPSHSRRFAALVIPGSPDIATWKESRHAAGGGCGMYLAVPQSSN